MTISGWLDPSEDTFVKELHQQHNVLGKNKIKGIGGSTVWLLTYGLPEKKS